jgi:GNAT superfamily N-acetyltransferase
MPRVMHTPKGEIEFRASNPGDLQAFRGLRLQALHDHPEAFSADYQTHFEGRDEIWKRYLDYGEHAMLYLAVHQEDLVGMTGVRMSTSPKTRHAAEIWGVYVLPGWRGLGITDALINACCDWAHGSGAVIAKLGVTTTNQYAVRCYERCGFVITGTDIQAIFTGGQYYDEYLMARSLS